MAGENLAAGCPSARGGAVVSGATLRRGGPMPIKVLHAADLHIDSPLRGLPDDGVAEVARLATRRAFERLVDLALAEATLLSAELALANAEAAEREAWAQAHLALGAGWRSEAL